MVASLCQNGKIKSEDYNLKIKIVGAKRKNWMKKLY
jgi:hypothetical protein